MVATPQELKGQLSRYLLDATGVRVKRAGYEQDAEVLVR